MVIIVVAYYTNAQNVDLQDAKTLAVEKNAPTTLQKIVVALAEIVVLI